MHIQNSIDLMLLIQTYLPNKQRQMNQKVNRKFYNKISPRTTDAVPLRSQYFCWYSDNTVWSLKASSVLDGNFYWKNEHVSGMFDENDSTLRYSLSTQVEDYFTGPQDKTAGERIYRMCMPLHDAKMIVVSQINKNYIVDLITNKVTKIAEFPGMFDSSFTSFYDPKNQRVYAIGGWHMVPERQSGLNLR